MCFICNFISLLTSMRDIFFWSNNFYITRTTTGKHTQEMIVHIVRLRRERWEEKKTWWKVTIKTNSHIIDIVYALCNVIHILLSTSWKTTWQIFFIVVLLVVYQMFCIFSFAIEIFSIQFFRRFLNTLSHI